jgi:hypothetical protein
MAMLLRASEMSASSPNTAPKAKDQQNTRMRQKEEVNPQPKNNRLRDFLRDVRVKNAAVRRFVKKKNVP